MIGFIFIIIAVICFIGIGYPLLIGNMFMFINMLIITALAGLAITAVWGALWEFYFPQLSKMFIATKRCASYELVCDDIGYGQVQPSKKYMPQGLVVWKFGWSLLPRPIMKLDFVQAIRKRLGRPLKDPDKEKQAQEQWEKRQQQIQGIEAKEAELAEQISLKKIMLKGINKPLWLQYLGLAANFNPYVLVPGEIKQDNPHQQFDQMRDFIDKSSSLSAQAKEEVKAKINDLETHCDKVRLVLDPRRFKEIHPKMYTQSQVDDHGRIHEEIGRLSVTGIPMKYIVIIIAVIAIVGVFAFIYFMFGPKGSPNQPAQQTTAMLHYLLQRVRK